MIARGKLLMFTEHRDTLNAVRESLNTWGYSTCEIHGGMNPHERKRAQEEFRAANKSGSILPLFVVSIW